MQDFQADMRSRKQRVDNQPTRRSGTNPLRIHDGRPGVSKQSWRLNFENLISKSVGVHRVPHGLWFFTISAYSPPSLATVEAFKNAENAEICFGMREVDPSLASCNWNTKIHEQVSELVWGEWCSSLFDCRYCDVEDIPNWLFQAQHTFLKLIEEVLLESLESFCFENGFFIELLFYQSNSLFSSLHLTFWMPQMKSSSAPT